MSDNSHTVNNAETINTCNTLVVELQGMVRDHVVELTTYESIMLQMILNEAEKINFVKLWVRLEEFCV
jgi:hypothetical protein